MRWVNVSFSNWPLCQAAPLRAYGVGSKLNVIIWGSCRMRTYVGTTGVVFLVLALVHLARLIAEGAGLLKQPTFVLTTLVSLVLAIWAAAVWTRLRPGT